MSKRENDGYCFINRRTKPQYMLSALHNIPYELLPPSLKRTEDFLVSIGIKPTKSYPPDLNKIDDDLKSSSKKMEEMYEKYSENKDKWMFRGTIPYIKDYSKCDWGQNALDAAKDLDIRSLYYGLEDGMYSLSGYLENIKHLLNDDGKEILEKRFESSHGDKRNKIDQIASDLYNNAYEYLHTAEEQEIRDELKMIKETLGSDAEWDEWHKAEPKIKQLQKDAETNLTKSIHKYWLENWYDKYAWDFDEEERESLKNPYK